MMRWRLYRQERAPGSTKQEADRTPDAAQTVFGEGKITIKIDPVLAYSQHFEKIWKTGGTTTHTESWYQINGEISDQIYAPVTILL